MGSSGLVFFDLIPNAGLHVLELFQTVTLLLGVLFFLQPLGPVLLFELLNVRLLVGQSVSYRYVLLGAVRGPGRVQDISDRGHHLLVSEVRVHYKL